MEGESPLDFLLRIMRDTTQEEARRIDCAKAAAPYCHAKLSSVEVANPEGESFKTTSRIELVPVEPDSKA